MPAKRTDPSMSNGLMNPKSNFTYAPAGNTDVRKTFERARAQQAAGLTSSKTVTNFTKRIA